MIRSVLVASALVLSSSCDAGDAEGTGVAESAMIAGPFDRPIPLAGDARANLPAPRVVLPADATAHFYWFAPRVSTGALVFEVRAERTALASGTVLHRAEEAIGEGQRQGMLSLGPRDLNRGGARRTDRGLAWLEGAFSIRVFDGEDELAVLVFEVE